MNRLLDILLRWYTNRVAFHTDVSKMYNAIKLNESDWCYQRYLWDDALTPGKEPEEKVIKTLIYGVKSSGNQAERGLRQTAELSKDEFPRVNSIINDDTFIDDVLSGEDDMVHAAQVADEMEIVLGTGGFGLKGFTFSGKDPPDKLTRDGQSISVAGMTWFSKDDLISIDIAELNFSKKVRGKKPTSSGKIPEKLTRRQCLSKVSEIFDISGKLTPITAAMKLDLHHFVQLQLGWDDAIPDNLRSVWETHFQMMEEIKHVKYSRCVIPEDAADAKISTLDFGDASKSIAAVAIYARVLRKCGKYSTQLIFARSKLIDVTTQPRGEMEAAVLNTHTGNVVRRALKDKHTGWTKITDSQIVLHWISNDDITLKPFTRNRVIEVQRFTNSNDWVYINTKRMMADIGTRKGAKLEDVNAESKWINGEDWMQEEILPTKKVCEIILTNSELIESRKESNSHASTEVFCNFTSTSHMEELKKRYSFSKYLLDPNKFRFRKVVRIIAIVI